MVALHSGCNVNLGQRLVVICIIPRETRPPGRCSNSLPQHLCHCRINEPMWVSENEKGKEVNVLRRPAGKIFRRQVNNARTIFTQSRQSSYSPIMAAFFKNHPALRAPLQRRGMGSSHTLASIF